MFIVDPKIDPPTEEEKEGAINYLKATIQETEQAKTKAELEELTNQIIATCVNLAKNPYSKNSYEIRERAFLHNLFDARTSFQLFPNLSITERIGLIKGIIISQHISLRLYHRLEDLTTKEKIDKVTRIISDSQTEEISYKEKEYFMKGIEYQIKYDEQQKLERQESYFDKMAMQSEEIRSAKEELLIALTEKDKRVEDYCDLHNKATQITTLCTKLASSPTSSDIWNLEGESHAREIAQNIIDAKNSFYRVENISMKDRLNLILGMFIGWKFDEQLPETLEDLDVDKRNKKINKLAEITQRGMMDSEEFNYFREGVSLGIKLRHENKQNKKSY